MTFLHGCRVRIRGGLLLAAVALMVSACAANDAVAAYPYPPYHDPALYGWAGLYDNGWDLGDGWYHHDRWHHGWADHGHWGHGIAHAAGGHR